MKSSAFIVSIFFSLIFSMVSVDLEAQFCCCPSCPAMDCIPQGLNANCGAACFFDSSCGNAGSAMGSALADCSGTGCNPLPAELINFKVRIVTGGVELYWSTASETENEGFEIQRGVGTTFEWEAIHFERGHGTTNETKEYYYFDRTPPPGDNYYRLQQVDFDGTKSYSEVEVASVEEQSKFRLWPTLAKSQVLIKADNSLHDQKLSAEIFDMLGRKVMADDFVVGGMALNISTLPKGQYIVNIFDRGLIETLRFVKVE